MPSVFIPSDSPLPLEPSDGVLFPSLDPDPDLESSLFTASYKRWLEYLSLSEYYSCSPFDYACAAFSSLGFALDYVAGYYDSN